MLLSELVRDVLERVVVRVVSVLRASREESLSARRKSGRPELLRFTFEGDSSARLSLDFGQSLLRVLRGAGVDERELEESRVEGAGVEERELPEGMLREVSLRVESLREGAGAGDDERGTLRELEGDGEDERGVLEPPEGAMPRLEPPEEPLLRAPPEGAGVEREPPEGAMLRPLPEGAGVEREVPPEEPELRLPEGEDPPEGAALRPEEPPDEPPRPMDF